MHTSCGNRSIGKQKRTNQCLAAKLGISFAFQLVSREHRPNCDTVLARLSNMAGPSPSWTGQQQQASRGAQKAKIRGHMAPHGTLQVQSDPGPELFIEWCLSYDPIIPVHRSRHRVPVDQLSSWPMHQLSTRLKGRHSNGEQRDHWPVLQARGDEVSKIVDTKLSKSRVVPSSPR